MVVVLAAAARRCGARRRRRVERALPAEVTQQPLAPAGPREAERLEESRPELGRHDVVEDRVDGRVEVEHHPAEVEGVVVGLHAETLHVLVGRQDDPQREEAERQQADEEEDDHRAQHGHHLAAGAQVRVDAFGSRSHRRRRLHLPKENITAISFFSLNLLLFQLQHVPLASRTYCYINNTSYNKRSLQNEHGVTTYSLSIFPSSIKAVSHEPFTHFSLFVLLHWIPAVGIWRETS